MFDTFIKTLKRALTQPLPGQQAHDEMLATHPQHINLKAKTTSRTQHGSVLILFYPKEDQVYFPLMLRPDYNGVHGGQISLPGGKKEKQDKDYIATAVRETEEEIGVRSKDIIVLGRLSTLYVMASDIIVEPVVGYTTHTPQFNPNPYEVQAIIESSVPEFMDDRIVKVKDMHVRGYDLEAPYFDIGGQVVWGATAMMLNELKHILRSEKLYGPQ